MRLNLQTPNVCYFHTTTWVGCVNAKHWYGSLTCGFTKIDVKEVLTEETARRLNDDDGYYNSYKVGELSTRFLSEAALLEAAIDYWHHFFPAAPFLIAGSSRRDEPQWVIFGPEDARTRINALYAECEKLGWRDGGNEGEVSRLCIEWEQIWKIIQ